MPMITLNIICELRNYNDDRTLYETTANACIPQIKMHVHGEIKATLETVTQDGARAAQAVFRWTLGGGGPGWEEGQG